MINIIEKKLEIDEGAKIIEAGINELKRQLLENEQSNDLGFNMESILYKRDLKFLNTIKFPNLYVGVAKEWNDLSRETKYKLIMTYVDDIELRYTIGKGYEVDKINFRSTFYNDFNKIFSHGYIDWFKNFKTVDGIKKIRFSNTLSKDEMENYILKLKKKYHITFNVGKLINPPGAFYVEDKPKENEIVRIFPLEGDIQDKEVNIGVISIDKCPCEDNFYKYIAHLPSMEEMFESYVKVVEGDLTSKIVTVSNDELYEV